MGMEHTDCGPDPKEDDLQLKRILPWMALIMMMGSCQKKELQVELEPPVVDHFIEDLKDQSCSLFNRAQVMLDQGAIEVGLVYFDRVAQLLDDLGRFASEDESFEVFAQDMMATIAEEESQVQADLLFEEDLPPTDLIADHLDEAPIGDEWTEEMTSFHEHFFFDEWDMQNPRTVDLLHNFTNRNAKSIRASLQRSGRFLPMIKAIFEEECLPEDLAYLPLIESGYRTSVRSRARAVGLWQFVQGTARMMGMRVDWWVDERRSPEASTRAAAKYLNYLYSEYEDWYLTLVAYNAGPGRVNRAIRKGKTRDFWTLARKRLLPRESRNYIPSFMAAVTIAKNPAAFGFTELEMTEPLETESLEVDFSIELERVAREIRCTESTLIELNPELRHKVTPGGHPPYRLKVPKGTLQQTKQALNEIPVNERVQWKEYVMRRGDTLGKIARKFGVSVYGLKTANNISNPRRLRVGKRLIIPFGPDEQVRHLVADSGTQTYRIRSGDTLSAIAKRFGMSLKRLQALNPGLDPRRLRPGQQISIGSNTLVAAPRTAAQGEWIIKRGDTLFDIARACGTRVKTLCELNGISASHILRPGRTLKIPTSNTGSRQHYAIRRGDTLSQIAKRFRVKLSDLLAWNQLQPDQILRIGQRIVVYR